MAKKLSLKTKLRIYFTWTSIVVCIFAFQNCGGGFESGNFSSQSASSLSSSSASFFQCNPSIDFQASQLIPLQKKEMINTYTDLLSSFSAADRNAILTAMTPVFAELPDDTGTQFGRLSQSVSPQHITAQYNLATKFATQVTSSAARLTSLGGSCYSAASVTQACVTTMLNSLGLKILRRPLSAAEVTKFYNFYVSRGTTGKADLIGLLLMTPEFLYHLENQGVNAPARPDLFLLTPYEVAAKISFQYWNSMPNTELFQAAASGELSSLAGIQNVLNSVVFGTQLARTKKVIDEYFTEWLRLDNLTYFTNMSPDFLAFTAGENINQPGYNHRADMLQEVRDLINYYTWTNPSGYKELLTSNISFAKTDALANIYGVAKWSGTGTPTVTFPPGERSGLLTRAALLASGGVQTDPINTGVRVTREILCNDLPSPPPDIDRSDTGGVTGPQTTMSSVHNLTNKPACISCHSVINPIGFAFESYDAFGRYRKTGQETLYNMSTGAVIATLPVDPSGDAQIIMGRTQHVKHAVDLSQSIADSGKGEACFAKNYYRFTVRRSEDNMVDGCSLAGLYDKLRDPAGGMQEMFKEVSLQQSFLVRKIEP
ncbi:MAG: DUF1588 domain-containing protein [Bdellovibrionota bacterium]